MDEQRVSDEWLRNEWREQKSRIDRLACIGATMGAPYYKACKYLWLIEAEQQRRAQRCETCYYGVGPNDVVDTWGCLVALERPSGDLLIVKADHYCGWWEQRK